MKARAKQERRARRRARRRVRTHSRRARLSQGGRRAARSHHRAHHQRRRTAAAGDGTGAPVRRASRHGARSAARTRDQRRAQTRARLQAHDGHAARSASTSPRACQPRAGAARCELSRRLGGAHGARAADRRRGRAPSQARKDLTRLDAHRGRGCRRSNRPRNSFAPSAKPRTTAFSCWRTSRWCSCWCPRSGA